MNRTVEGVWKDGRIVPDRAVDWPEGQRLRVEPITVIPRGMTEEEQGDDPESIEKWIAEWRDLPPLVMSPEDEAAWREWERISAEYNLEAARRQMNEKFV